MAIGIQTAHANNMVVDMSQVQDYNQYQMDLQQCEGLAVQNQPDAPQREAVAGTAVRGAASRCRQRWFGVQCGQKGAGVGVIAAAAQPQPPRRERQCQRAGGSNREELHARTGLQRSELKAALALAWPLAHCATHRLG